MLIGEIISLENIIFDYLYFYDWRQNYQNQYIHQYFGFFIIGKLEWFRIFIKELIEMDLFNGMITLQLEWELIKWNTVHWMQPYYLKLEISNLYKVCGRKKSDIGDFFLSKKKWKKWAGKRIIFRTGPFFSPFFG